MRRENEGTRSAWMATSEVPTFPSLTGDHRADVCVVGGGISGLTTAYLLAREGRSVAVVDDGEIGGGETGRTTAHLSNALDDRFVELERMHGERAARLAAASHGAAIDRIEGIVAEEGISCDFKRVDGYLFAAPGQTTGRLEEELAAAHRAGLVGVRRLDRAPLPSFDTGPCLQFPQQAQFHPLRYLAGLAGAIVKLRGRIFTRTHAERIEGGPDARVVTSAGHTISAGAVVVATNSPVNDVVAIHTKQAPYRTYVIAARVARGAVPEALYWDDGDPYHYVRLQPLGDAPGDEGLELLIVGGEDHKTGQAEEYGGQFARLEAWMRERFPEALEVEHAWSGQVMEPVDGLAYIGRNPMDDDNVFVATGDSGHGMTHGTIAGILLTDLIEGRENPWEEIYSPSRITPTAAGTFLEENLNVAGQYADYVTPGEVDSPESVAPGEGAVVRSGATKLAVYRDASGALHQRSAVCTHLGCVVRWNGLEKSWDCPCHGSRFAPDGAVLNGPAIRALAPVDEE